MLKDLSYLYPVFPILASIAAFLSLLPIPLHWGAGNITMVALSFWCIIGCIICAIDTCIWHGNLRNPHPIWGDIVQVYCVMICPAVASCTMYIQYRLWTIARIKSVFITKQQKRRQKLSAYFFSFGIPSIIGVVHYVVQGHRYDVWEDLGPWFTIYNVAPAFPLYYCWTPIFCFIGAIFAIHTLFLLLTQQKEVDIALNSGSAGINRSRYIRLLSIIGFSTCVELPLSTWSVIWNAVAIPVHPWISWQDTHFNYHRIAYLDRFMIGNTANMASVLSADLWSLVAYTFGIFIFFGLSEDAIRQYRSWALTLLRPFGVEFQEPQRRTAKRTWIDILLRRPARPMAPDSFPRNARVHQSTFRTQSTHLSTHDTQPVDSQMSSRQATALHDHVTSHNTTTNDNTSLEDIPELTKDYDSTAGASTEGPNRIGREMVNAGLKGEETTAEKINEVDLEGQQMPVLTIEEQRRKETLERNPELTEEVSF